MHTFNAFAAFVRNAETGSGSGVSLAPLGTEAATVQPASASNVAAPKRNAKPGREPANAKPGKPAAKRAAKPEAEAQPDPRVARAERIAAERSDVNAFYAAFEANRASVPVKPLSAFKPVATTAHPIARNPSERQAAAICAALSAAGVKLSDGAKAPRVFERNGVRVCVENGVLRDAVSSGLVTVSGNSPETETITVRAKQAATIGGLIGGTILKRAKLA